MNLSPSTVEPPAYGFTLAAGSLVIRLGYRLDGNIVTLFATTQIGQQEPQMWRQFSAPRESAVDAAHELVCDACEYADATNAVVRPTEDLDLGDFVTHLAMNLNGELH